MSPSPSPSRQQWSELVDQVARRAGLIPQDAAPGAGETALTGTDLDGIRIRPLYTADDSPTPPPACPGAAPFVRGARAGGPVPDGWDVRQRHARPRPGGDRARPSLADLENGVTSLWLVVGDGGMPVAALRRRAGRRLPRPGPGRAGRRAGRRRGAPRRSWRWPRSARRRRRRAARQPRRRPARPARPHRRRARPRRRSLPLARRCAEESPAGAGGGRGRDCPSTRPAARTPRSWAARWPPGSPTCGR